MKLEMRLETEEEEEEKMGGNLNQMELKNCPKSYVFLSPQI